MDFVKLSEIVFSDRQNVSKIQKSVCSTTVVYISKSHLHLIGSSDFT